MDVYIPPSKPVLYAYPPSRSGRVVWLLHELNLVGEVEIRNVDLSKGEQRNVDFLKINPAGKVPALEDGEVSIGESAAIIQYLLRKFNHNCEPWVPEDKVSLALYDSIILMTIGLMDNAVFPAWLMLTITPDKQDAAQLKGWRKVFQTNCVPVLDKYLAKNKFLTGPEMTVADIVVGDTLRTAYLLGWIEKYPKLVTYLERLSSRPAFKATFGALNNTKLNTNGSNDKKEKPTLYTFPSSRGARVVWLLNELGRLDRVNIQLINIIKGQQKSVSFLELNPSGKVPVLVDHKEIITESGAICSYLLKKFNKAHKYIPTDPKAFALYESAILLTVGTMDNIVIPAYLHYTFEPKASINEKKLARWKEEFENNCLGSLKMIIGDHKYIASDQFTLADIIVGYTLNFAYQLEWLKEHKILSDYMERLKQRKAFRVTYDDIEAEMNPLALGSSSPPKPLYPQMVLYHIPRTRSSRVAWLINEIGGSLKSSIKIVVPEWKNLKKPDYRSVNPNGLVPAMSIGNENLWEAGSIINSLLNLITQEDRDRLLPPAWTEENWKRHNLYSWWTIVTVDQRILENFFGPSRVVGKISGTVAKWFGKVVAPVLIKDLATNSYINGPTFTATDIFVTYSLALANELSLLKEYPPLSTYLALTTSRPAFLEAFSVN